MHLNRIDTVLSPNSVSVHGEYDNQANESNRTLSIDLLVNADTPIEIKIKKIKDPMDAIDLPHETKENGELRWIGDDRKLKYLTATKYEQAYAIVINKGTADITILKYSKGLRELLKG